MHSCAQVHDGECSGAGRQGKHACNLQQTALQAAKEAKQDAQVEAESLATWQLLGSRPEQLWLLSEDQVRAQCELKGLAPGLEDSKEDMIGGLVQVLHHVPVSIVGTWSPELLHRL